MTTHYEEELFALLSGELDHEETLKVVGHLRECGECTSELISVAVAFGSLRATQRVERLLRGEVAETGIEVPSPFEGLASQPPLTLTSRRVTPLARWAAAAVLLVALVVGVSFAFARTSSAPVSATAVLRHLDSSRSVKGLATVRSSDQAQLMDIVTSGLPAAPANHFYEVWLLQPATNKMLPVGLLSPSGRGTYSVASAMMSQYSAVDISLQVNNGDPAHSKVSVLRGKVVSVLS